MTALNRSVLVGGVVYPAGTEATEELLAKIRNPRLWGEDEPADKAVSVDVDVDVAGFQAALAAAQERVDELEAALAARDEEIAALTAQATPADTGDANGDPDTAPAPVATTVDYSTLDVEALKAEIDKRNEGRDDGARISKRGSQETLAAALTADDATAPQG
ncbi:hypothetical protein [Nocardioides sp. SLBN-35]|uniref:hypothetical protein n=1 Tax=Nocardioides sp. SLBN-35 TaxID=2768445 RepID=UPI00114DF12C|nr:hypothetical protein [Nocardioides sp. SLBN-35]TQK73368.1 hypothetical protein FBY23_5200 [Nocardioides sp. SLBN-35]